MSCPVGMESLAWLVVSTSRGTNLSLVWYLSPSLLFRCTFEKAHFVTEFWILQYTRDEIPGYWSPISRRIWPPFSNIPNFGILVFLDASSWLRDIGRDIGMQYPEFEPISHQISLNLGISGSISRTNIRCSQDIVFPVFRTKGILTRVIWNFSMEFCGAN